MSVIIQGGRSVILGSSGAPSSVTGTLTETQLASIVVPAGSMGVSGQLRVTTEWSYTNSANNKTLNVKWGGIGGTNFLGAIFTTTAGARFQQTIANKGSAASQKGWASSAAFGSFPSAFVTSAIDTSAATTLVISAQLANTGETITLEGYTVELIPGV